MALYTVKYHIKRDKREYEARHITEAANATEAIKKTREFIDANHLPHAFRPEAKKLGEIEIPNVEWKNDGITRRYVTENAGMLANPSKMEPSKLADATTYCATIRNPYAEELMKRAGNLEAFKATHDHTEQWKILQKAARAFGIVLF